jgi:hypothetical protein
MFNPSKLASLPTLARVEAHPHRAAFLYLEGVPGYDFLPRLAPAALCPLPDGSGVLLDNLEDPRRAYRVPAHLCAPLARALSLRRVSA